jgi:hypothetical protein
LNNIKNTSSSNTSDPALCRAAVATLGCIARQGTASSEALASDGKVLDVLCNLLVSATTASSATIDATDNAIVGRNSALNSITSGNTHHHVSLDERLIRQTVLVIGDIARSGPHLADSLIVSKGILESIVKLLSISTSQKGENNIKRDDPLLRRHCAALLRDITRHGLAQATAVAHCSPGVLHQLTASCISGLTGNDLLPGIIAVGFVGAHAALAPLVADAGAIPALASVLMRESLDHVLSATVWALGQIGRQSHSLAAAVAVTGAGAIMADLEFSSSVPITATATNNSSSSPTKVGREDLNKKCEEALSKIIKQLNELPPLEVLLQRPLTKCTAEAVLQRVAEILASQPTTKAAFVQSGGLKIVQTISETTDSYFKDHISAITSQFPKEICNYFSPAYNASLLQLVASSTAADETVSRKMVFESEEVFIDSPYADDTAGDEVALSKEEEEEEGEEKEEEKGEEEAEERQEGENDEAPFEQVENVPEQETEASPPPVTADIPDLETTKEEVEVVGVIEEEGEKEEPIPSIETSSDDPSLDTNQPGEEVQQDDDVTGVIEDAMVAINNITTTQDIGNEEQEDLTTPTSVVESIATVFTQNEDETEERGIDDDGIVDPSAAAAATGL